MTRSQTQTAVPRKRLPARKSKKMHLTTVIQCSTEEKFHMLKEKNKESAQRSRDNKKRYLTGLENKISELTLQNEYLRKQLSSCHCSRSEDNPTQDSNTMNTGSYDQPKIVEESPEKSIFERVSFKSFASCSNFLILSLVMLFCVFGYVDVTGQASKPNGLFYSQDHLKTAMANWQVSMGSCNNSNTTPKPPKFSIVQDRNISILTVTGKLEPGESRHSNIQRTLEIDPRMPQNASKLLQCK